MSESPDVRSAVAAIPEAPVDIPAWLEALAIVAGATAGALRAIRDKLAISGVVALAVALGLGGGIIRDSLLQKGTPVAFTDPWFLAVAIAATIPVLILSPLIHRLERPVFAVDALAIGMYSILGADKALQYDIPPVGAAMIGVLAGTGGSILADLAIGVPPMLFRPGLLLGVASACGTIAYVIGVELTGARAAWFFLGVVMITGIRVVSMLTGRGVGPADQIVARSEAILNRLPSRGERDAPKERVRFRRRGSQRREPPTPPE